MLTVSCNPDTETRISNLGKYSDESSQEDLTIGLLKQYGFFPIMHSKSLKFPGLYLRLDRKQQR